MRGLESTALYSRGVAARPGGLIDPPTRRAQGGARGLPAPRDSGRGASDRWRAVTVYEPGYAVLNTVVWQGDAAPPLDPPALRAAVGALEGVCRPRILVPVAPMAVRLRHGAGKRCARQAVWPRRPGSSGRATRPLLGRAVAAIRPSWRADTGGAGPPPANSAHQRATSWGSKGRSPSPGPCRGPAKRGPKGYAGS